MHLSSAAALPIIEEAKRAGAPLTVETTHHYLCLNAEGVPQGATYYKCCPPIRSKENQVWKLFPELTEVDVFCMLIRAGMGAKTSPEYPHSGN